MVEGRGGSEVECVSTVVLGEEEAREALLLEASLHERFGYEVTVGFNLDGDPDVVIARHPRHAQPRILTVRAFSALEDVL